MKRLGFVAMVFAGLIIAFSMSACSKSPEEKRVAYLKSAKQYMDEGKYGEASIQFRNALKIVPDDADTLVSLGKVELKRHRVRDAYFAFSRASKVDPSNIEARQYLASLFLVGKRYQDAIKEARAILARDPGNVKAVEVLSQALFLTGKREQGIREIEKILRQKRPSQPVFLNAIEMYTGVGKTEDALRLVKRGVSIYPKSVKLRLIASDILASKGNIKDAQRWVEAAYEVSGRDIDTGLALATFYHAHGMGTRYRSIMDDLEKRFPRDARPYALEANVFRQGHDLKNALESANKARNLEDTPQNRYLVCEVLVQMGKVRKAQDILEKTVKDFPSFPDTRLLLARIYMSSKAYDKALNVMSPLVKNMPLRPDVASVAASAYLAKGNIERAQGLVDNSLKVYKASPSLHSMMARIYFLKGGYGKVIEQVDLLRDLNSCGLEEYLLGFISAIKKGDMQRSENYSREMEQINKRAWPSIYAMALVDMAKGKVKDAYIQAEKAVKYWPGKPEALRLYAGLAEKTEGLDKAIDLVKGVCEKDRNAYCHLVLSGLMEKKGDIGDALAQIKQAISMEPGQVVYYYALASFYSRHNMKDEAIRTYEGVVNKRPSDLGAATMLALLYHSSSRLKDARKLYEYILDKDPGNVVAANNLAWILATGEEKADLDKALHLAQLAKDKLPDDPKVADTLGYVYLKKGLYDNAKGQFLLALEKLPDEPSIEYHMAQALASQGRRKEALKYLRKALKKEFSGRDDALMLLQQLEKRP